MRRFLIFLLALGLVGAMVVLALALRPAARGAQPGRAANGAQGASENSKLADALDAPNDVVQATDARRTQAQLRPETAADVPAGRVRVHFRVVARGNGRPLPGAQLRRAPDWGAVVAVTDSRGESTIDFEADEDGVAVEASCRHHAFTRRIVVPATQGDPLFVLELAPNVAAFGRVVDRDGEPGSGAELALAYSRAHPAGGVELRDMSVSPAFDEPLSFAYSQADGSFRFEDVEHERALSLTARATGEGVAVVEVPGRNEGGDIDLGVIRLGGGAMLSGRVVRAWRGETIEQGEPVAGVRVRAKSRSLRVLRLAANGRIEIEQDEAVTDANGGFEFTELYPVEYEVTAIPGDEFGTVVVMQAGRAKGGPAHAYTKAVVDLRQAPASPIVITTDRTSELRGRVLTPELEPAPHASLVASFATYSMKGRSDAEGRFVITGLGRVPVALSIRPASATTGVLPETMLELVVPGGADVQVVLAAADWIEGRVVDANGKPVENAGVTATSTTGAHLELVYAGADGRFRLRIPRGEAVDLEACPSRKKDERTLTLDEASPNRGFARGARAGTGPIELVLLPRR